VDSQPTYRMAPGAKQSVSFDEIVEALRSLDEPPAKWKRVLRRTRGDNPDSNVPMT
jgi:hypothetical protein